MKTNFEDMFPLSDPSVYDFSGIDIIDRVGVDPKAAEGWKLLATVLACEIKQRSKNGKIKTWCGLEMAYEQSDGSLVLACNYIIGKKKEAITMLVPKGDWQFNNQQN